MTRTIEGPAAVVGCIAIVALLVAWFAGLAALATGGWNYVVVPLAASLGAHVNLIDWPLGLGGVLVLSFVASLFRSNR